MFLDELGEMDLAIQVKLLRVIETRKFSAVGDTVPRDFHGKLIAATNRDLPAEIRAGRFREDLYYRLCADLIQTPSLADQIRDSPLVLRELVHYMTLRTVGDEAERCLPEIEEWIANEFARRLCVAGKLSGTGTVCAKCDYPALVSASGAGAGNGNEDRVLCPLSRGAVERGRCVSPLRGARVSIDRQL